MEFIFYGSPSPGPMGGRLLLSRFGRKKIKVNYKGTVKNGVVVLPPEVKLAEGAEVNVEPVELLPQDDPFLAAVLKLAKPRPHWPKDYALNHGHYVGGEPKKS